VDKNFNILAGNATVRSATGAGIDEDAVVVESDGTKLIVVRRMDLDINSPKAKALAVADNRTSELGLEWDPDVLRDLSGEIDLQPFFDTSELKELGVTETAINVNDIGIGDAPPDSRYKAQYGVIVVCKDEAEQRDVYDRLSGEGLECKVVVT
jgi:hypothetical protein